MSGELVIEIASIWAFSFKWQWMILLIKSIGRHVNGSILSKQLFNIVIMIIKIVFCLQGLWGQILKTLLTWYQGRLPYLTFKRCDESENHRECLFNQLIAAPQLEGYYKTVHNTYYERRNCRDQDSSCPALKSACHDPVVKSSCPVTCGTCAQFEEVSKTKGVPFKIVEHQMKRCRFPYLDNAIFQPSKMKLV